MQDIRIFAGIFYFTLPYHQGKASAGYGANTSFHLAEYRAPGSTPMLAGAPILEHGTRTWKDYRDIESDVDLFPIIGLDFETTKPVIRGQSGSAPTRFSKQRDAVDFAILWLEQNRKIKNN